MRSSAVVALAVSALLACCPWVSGQDGPSEGNPDFDYASELATLESGNTDVDFTSLRFAFAESEGFSPLAMKERELRKKTVAAVNDGDCDTALSLVAQILDINYLYPDAHLGAMICHESQGNAEAAAFDNAVLKGLFRSICGPKEGNESSSPCKVIATYEEYFVLEALGLQFTEQSLIRCNGQPCDEMKAVDPESGEEISMFFDVSIPFARMAD